LAQTHWKWVTCYHKIAVRIVMRSAHQIGHCTNRIFGGPARCGCWASPNLRLICRWRLWYAEDRDYPAWPGDLDPGDERLDQGLSLAVAANATMYAMWSAPELWRPPGGLFGPRLEPTRLISVSGPLMTGRFGGSGADT
jgi:hypothetical protein